MLQLYFILIYLSHNNEINACYQEDDLVYIPNVNVILKVMEVLMKVTEAMVKSQKQWWSHRNNGEVTEAMVKSQE